MVDNLAQKTPDATKTPSTQAGAQPAKPEMKQPETKPASVNDNKGNADSATSKTASAI